MAKIDRTLMSLEMLANNLAELQDHLRGTPHSHSTWFEQFEAMWSPIIGNDLYSRIFSFFLTKERTFTERYWSEMYIESDLNRKHRLLLECVGPLVEGLARLVPQMTRHLGNLHVRLLERS